jgi:hypothetical protein
MDFANKFNSIEVSARGCEITHAYNGPKKGILVTDAPVGKTIKTIHGVVPIGKDGKAVLVPDKNETIRIPAVPECVIKVDDKRKLLLHNSKKVFQLR